MPNRSSVLLPSWGRAIVVNVFLVERDDENLHDGLGVRACDDFASGHSLSCIDDGRRGAGKNLA
jgi:hypothetical protein